MIALFCRLAVLPVVLVLLGIRSADAEGAGQPPKPAPKPQAKPAPKVPRDPKWTFEVFGGLGVGGSVSGDGAEFPAGEVFTTDGGFSSRSVPSWYFGDGAVLFNEVRTQFASRFNVNLPQIVALDPFFTRGLERQGGPTFGARLTRRLTPRTSIEFGLQRSHSKVAINSDGRAAIEASRDSFDQAFRALLATVPHTNLLVTSTATIPEATDAPQLTLSGVVNLLFPGRTPSPARRTFTPFVSAGLAYVSTSAETMTLTMRGNYQFRFLDANRFNEVDNVTIRIADRDSTVVGILGAGVLYATSPRHGFRADARVHVGKGGMTTELDASPQINTAPPALALPSNTDPSIQFSNTTAARTSLSGRISDQTVSSGGGIDTRFHLTVGYYFRF